MSEQITERTRPLKLMIGFETDLTVSERPSGEIYRVEDVEEAFNAIKSEKTLVLTGGIGSGKTTTILELAHTLEEKGQPFIMFSGDVGKEQDVKVLQQNLSLIKRMLESYPDLPVLVENGDVLAHQYSGYGDGRLRFYNWNGLVKRLENDDSLTEYERNVLETFKLRADILNLLSSRRSGVVVTKYDSSDGQVDAPNGINNGDTLLSQIWKEGIEIEPPLQVSQNLTLEKSMSLLSDQLLLSGVDSIDERLIRMIADNKSASYLRLKRFPVSEYTELLSYAKSKNFQEDDFMRGRIRLALQQVEKR